jgi:hypothetical protein
MIIPDHMPIPIVENQGSDYVSFPIPHPRPVKLIPVKLVTHQPPAAPVVIPRKPVQTFYQWLADLIGEYG